MPIKDATHFEGFDTKAVSMLAKLPGFDERAYSEQRERFKAGLREPGAALISGLASKLSPGLRVDARSSVSPLHRDLRFAKAGTPRYKDHLLLTAWEGAEKRCAPILWVRVDAKSVGFASGIAFTPKVRDAWRDAVAGKTGAALSHSLDKLAKKHSEHNYELAGDLLKRVPKPWDEEHPREALLRLKNFQVRFQEPLPKSISSGKFAAWCEKRLADLFPVHRWLVAHVA